MPNLVVIAGPNGAGKSTAAPLLIGKRLGIAEFVNADVIAAGLSAYSPESVAVEAGRIMQRRLQQLSGEGKDFSFETTLASRSFAPWIVRLRQERGYRFHLIFLWVPDPSQSVARVASRVHAGGISYRTKSSAAATSADWRTSFPCTRRLRIRGRCSTIRTPRS